MHRLGIGIGTLLAVLTAGMPQAGAAPRAPHPYCLDAERTHMKDCSYRSFQQCLQTAHGLGGICYPNPEILWRLREGHAQPAPRRSRARQY
jgi:Protein of unknown function (DUF3551)